MKLHGNDNRNEIDCIISVSPYSFIVGMKAEAAEIVFGQIAKITYGREAVRAQFNISVT